ncbi:hypothetical protein [Pectinatus frisingensis]|uniref:hypothetical protein n=1 Tax=Pectinatus frisingensis TaxID=865 RepID=UPI0018C52AF2|nr:hypothetical protein [Pectinatus frisingensis]
MISFNKNNSIFIIVIFVLPILYYFSFPSIIRYKIEKEFMTPNTFLSGMNIAVEANGNYTLEKNVDDDNTVSFSKGNHQKIYAYGNIVNSNDDVSIFLNNKNVRDISITNNNFPCHFWDRFYLNKSFVVELPVTQGENELIITTGNSQNKYYININDNNF